MVIMDATMRVVNQLLADTYFGTTRPKGFSTSREVFNAAAIKLMNPKFTMEGGL
jgi:hypothetical protein